MLKIIKLLKANIPGILLFIGLILVWKGVSALNPAVGMIVGGVEILILAIIGFLPEGGD